MRPPLPQQSRDLAPEHLGAAGGADDEADALEVAAGGQVIANGGDHRRGAGGVVEAADAGAERRAAGS